jgi:hypothetical protein
MKKNQTESLIKYVAEMHDRREEYKYNSLNVISDLQESDTDVSEEMEEIYQGISGSRICSICNNSKLYDDKNEEFYCPLHN